MRLNRFDGMDFMVFVAIVPSRLCDVQTKRELIQTRSFHLRYNVENVIWSYSQPKLRLLLDVKRRLVDIFRQNIFLSNAMPHSYFSIS
ncbi:hypothetical protein CEXT_66951 [Caerostris extrusa]|uniref:Uncharacterized protein n=1 Tax=Caerostris extrusa TaxID=172846 RepID=A0AAV4MXW3_CAEEX|nr:hypothetical protein CEXT_66951 [Caerostris extrusa]